MGRVDNVAIGLEIEGRNRASHGDSGPGASDSLAGEAWAAWLEFPSYLEKETS
jgi:hypothetical protein